MNINSEYQSEDNIIESKLAMAKMYFSGASSTIPQDTNEAIQICLEILGIDQKSPLANPRISDNSHTRQVFRLIFEFAEAFRTGQWRQHKVKRNLSAAYMWYMFIRTEAKCDTSIKAKRILHSPRFILKCGREMQAKKMFDKAADLYSLIRIPERLTNTRHPLEVLSYYHGVLNTIQLVKDQYMLVSAVLDDPSASPKTAFNIATSYVEQEEFHAANCVLMAIDKEKIKPASYEKLVNCIKLGFKKDSEVTSGALSETEKSKFKKLEAEYTYVQITELLKLLEEDKSFKNFMRDEKHKQRYEACETALSDLAAIINTLERQLEKTSAKVSRNRYYTISSSPQELKQNPTPDQKELKTLFKYTDRTLFKMFRNSKNRQSVFASNIFTPPESSTPGSP